MRPVPGRFATHIFAALLLSAVVGPRSAAADTATIDPVITAFMQTHCVRCHGPEKQNASLRFDTMPVALADEATAQRWQDILDALNLDEMPPEDEPQPADDELSQVLETLTKNLLEARERLNDVGGRQVLRRLNRREYQNTIRDLLGLDVSIESLPDDATVDGFDTIGVAHTFSSLHLERYLDAGATLIDRFLETSGNRREPEVRRYDPETTERDDLKAAQSKLKGMLKGSENLRPAPDGEARRIDVQLLNNELITEYLDHPASKTGALVPFRGLMPTFRVEKLLGRNGIYKVRVRCGVDAPQPVDGLFLEVRRVPRQTMNIDRVDCYEVRGTVAEPEIVEFEMTADGIIGNYLNITRRTPKCDVLPRFANLNERHRGGNRVCELADDTLPNLWVDWIETEGPFPQFEGALDRSVVNLHPTRATDDEARRMIEAVSFEAFRRAPPDPEFVDRVLNVFQMTRANGADATVATRECLKVVLASPRFLFLYEPSADGESRPLTDRELAVRLAYFLWSAPPDDALYAAAESGELGTPRGLATQLDRLLASPKSDQFVVNFLTQFLELQRLGGVDPDAVAAAKYDRALQKETKQEVFEFFRYLLREDRPAHDLIDADYVVVNGLLADFYDLPDVHGDRYRPVKLPADSPRGGMLGQSAVLALTGTGERTSPVERGAFVLRKLLHRPPPPAPANVPMLDETGLGNRSIRETLSIHMNKPQCSSCHRRIDPLGFGLENFDPAGLWRDTVASADKTTQFPIEPAGLMPDGKRRFATPHEMKQLMMADRDAFLTGLTEAIMTYGIGRKIGYADRAEVERIVAAVGDRGYGLRTLLHEIVQSEPFQTK